MILELKNVTKAYPVRRRRKGWFNTRQSEQQAIQKVSLELRQGECLGLVGESGSGKSTLAQCILGLESLTSGEIWLDHRPIHTRRMKDIHLYKRIQLVAQDSASSLHPRMTIQDILMEPIRNYFPKRKVRALDICLSLLESVGLEADSLGKYPAQLSGGQKQRVCIARALAVEPEIILFDESVANLDTTTQSSVLDMLKRMQLERQLSYLFITHDLQSTRTFCDRVAVMVQGEIVEIFEDWDEELLKHEYTRALFQTLAD
ncbi:nickel ABC transporter ATP-binding protein [Paenibacillus jamilae]|uniref:Nickel ABC transporter ATP-binding protein n=2 Tax=Paenibacillus TaxID=44249 RepID=E3E903_PAEPS|nr:MULTISPECIES: dipeptide/oligopeptide/nickel ABC transporter ATP-binding protein [Paenibacillus]MBU9706119.1 dipeptide/oligopeptide/nickel ABC transporter ATP-binding protein [Paenibacillus sp. AK121]ADO59210.1 nickel ABC transporter ATP-binding protein [Paenibacillus polymyxa SC2]AUO06588.1 ABC transporter ATP-binding protein [Paenibacillus sp. lzh-N1]KAE8561984.1 nickel ABC transporter ATP-binding protein [Paenibacillus polymyxa]KTS82405.1 nickel ABC transporter ATP-binding protein [Paenib